MNAARRLIVQEFKEQGFKPKEAYDLSAKHRKEWQHAVRVSGGMVVHDGRPKKPRRKKSNFIWKLWQNIVEAKMKAQLQARKDAETNYMKRRAIAEKMKAQKLAEQ